MTSKYSRVKGPQGLPKVCKRQPEFCDPLIGLPPTFQALVNFDSLPYSGAPPGFNDVLTLLPHLTESDTWTGKVRRDTWVLTFDFTTVDPTSQFSAAMHIQQHGFDVYDSEALSVAFNGTLPFDTLRVPLSPTFGVGNSHFRVLL